MLPKKPISTWAPNLYPPSTWMTTLPYVCMANTPLYGEAWVISSKVGTVMLAGNARAETRRNAASAAARRGRELFVIEASFSRRNSLEDVLFKALSVRRVHGLEAHGKHARLVDDDAPEGASALPSSTKSKRATGMPCVKMFSAGGLNRSIAIPPRLTSTIRPDNSCLMRNAKRNAGKLIRVRAYADVPAARVVGGELRKDGFQLGFRGVGAERLQEIARHAHLDHLAHELFPRLYGVHNHCYPAGILGSFQIFDELYSLDVLVVDVDDCALDPVLRLDCRQRFGARGSGEALDTEGKKGVAERFPDSLRAFHDEEDRGNTRSTARQGNLLLTGILHRRDARRQSRQPPGQGALFDAGSRASGRRKRRRRCTNASSKLRKRLTRRESEPRPAASQIAPDRVS